MSDSSPQVFEFGPFRADVQRRILERDGQPIPLSGKAFEILLVLLRHPGELVEKEVLMREVWPGTAVEENNLTVNISGLVQVSGRDGGQPADHHHGSRAWIPLRRGSPDTCAPRLPGSRYGARRQTASGHPEARDRNRGPAGRDRHRWSVDEAGNRHAASRFFRSACSLKTPGTNTWGWD